MKSVYQPQLLTGVFGMEYDTLCRRVAWLAEVLDSIEDLALRRKAETKLCGLVMELQQVVDQALGRAPCPCCQKIEIIPRQARAMRVCVRHDLPVIRLRVASSLTPSTLS